MVSTPQKVQQFKKFLRGYASSSFMGWYIASVLTLYVLVIILARSFFPGGYSALDHTISTQGGIADNPDGWWIYCGGIIIVGILLIPIQIYLYHRLQPTLLFVSRLVLFFSLMGAIGFSFLGVFPHDYPESHDIATGAAFGGFILAAVLSFFVLFRKLQLKESWPTKKGFYLAYFHWWIMVVLIVIFQELDDWFDMSAYDPRYFSYSVVQWTAMVTVLMWMVGMYLNSRNATILDSE